MDETDDQPEARPPTPAPLSKTSSWITLGFLLGAATVWAYLSHQEKTAPATPALTAWPVKKQFERASLTEIEAVFARYQEYAVWDKNVTEVVMWRRDTGAFDEFYEVRRAGEEFYFRSILHFSAQRRLINHGKPLGNEVPLRFSETEAQYAEWFEHGRFERSDDASLQPTLLGPTLVPAGETVPKPAGARPRIDPAPNAPGPAIDRPKAEFHPETKPNE